MAIIEADSTSLADVQDVIDSAVTDDTVIVPAGSSTWSGVAEIDDDQKITVQANGIGNTIITRSGMAFNIHKSDSRITGFEFRSNNYETSSGFITIEGGTTWRVDHCRFYDSSAAACGVRIFGDYASNPIHPIGLIDNCDFYNKGVLVYGTGAELGERSDAHVLWHEQVDLGSGNFVFIEDCDFIHTVFGNCVDANLAGRYVFRHNTVTDVYAEAHSVQGNTRASRKWEIYENIFITTIARWTAMYLRGGTGVIFNNTLTGSWSNGLVLDNVRDTESRPTCGKCDGSSSWDENTTDEAGWRCRDQIGCGGDDSLWTPENPYPHQAHEPLYIWNNTLNGGTFTVLLFGQSSPPHIVLDRDYYLSAKSGYTPYVYPHPLQGGGSANPYIMIFK